MAYVYLITEEPYEGEVCNAWTKIGYSQNPPEWRMNANLKRGNPRNIRVAAAFEFATNQDARDAEKRAHIHFLHLRHQKEWFKVAWHEVASWLDGIGANRRPEITGPVA